VRNGTRNDEEESGGAGSRNVTSQTHTRIISMSICCSSGTTHVWLFQII